ncbi:hypothetical protein D3C84_330020 [compost metagenome]
MLCQQRQLPVRVELARRLTQGFAHGIQGGQVGRHEHPVVAAALRQLIKAQDIQGRAINAQHLRQFRLLHAIAVIDTIEIDPGVQRLGEGWPAKAQFQHPQALPGRQCRQALGEGFAQTGKHALLTGRPQHQTQQVGAAGFPRQQLLKGLTTVEQCLQMAADTTHRMNDLEVFRVALEQLLPDGLGRWALARLDNVPGAVGIAAQAAVFQAMTQQRRQVVARHAVLLRPQGNLLGAQMATGLVDQVQHEA